MKIELNYLMLVGVTLILGLSFWVSTLPMVNAANPKVTLFIAGDSTASNYTADVAPRMGWGQVLGRFFDENDITINNMAVSGRSSKSFIDEGVLAKILKQIKPNDYLFIQFGHNDEKKEDPARYTEPFTTYKAYLTQYIQGARQAGAIPILLTPICRHSFDKNGRLKPTHGDYPKAMIELGAELKVPVIDITEKSRVLFEGLGPEKTQKLFLYQQPGENPNYPKGVQDDTHFQENGAKEIAKLVLQGIRELKLPLGQYIKAD